MNLLTVDDLTRQPHLQVYMVTMLHSR